MSLRWLPISIALGAGCAAAPAYVTLPAHDVRTVALGLIDGGDRFCVAGPEAQLRATARLADGRTLTTWRYRVDGTRDGDGHRSATR